MWKKSVKVSILFYELLLQMQVFLLTCLLSHWSQIEANDHNFHNKGSKWDEMMTSGLRRAAKAAHSADVDVQCSASALSTQYWAQQLWHWGIENSPSLQIMPLKKLTAKVLN